MFWRKKNNTEVQGENATATKKYKRKKKKFIIIGIVIAFILIGVVFVPRLLPHEAPPLSVTTSLVATKDVEQIVSIKGTIEGSQKADVATSLNYEIVSILVEEGDQVKKDQVLAVLDAEDLQDDYEKTSKTLAQSKFAYESAKSLYDEGAISKEDYIKAETQYQTDKITLDAYNITDKVNIKSPIAGTVTRVNVNIGRYANDTENSEPMFVVEDLENLKMNVKISEYDISKIKIGQQVTISAEVLGKETVTGVVSRISPTGEQKDNTSKEMVIPVQIDVSKGSSGLIAGVTAKADIEIEKHLQVMAIPIDGILEDPSTGETAVFVVKEDSTIQKIPVTLGLEGDFDIEVINEELHQGDAIVLNPSFDMVDGMAVITETEE